MNAPARAIILSISPDLPAGLREQLLRVKCESVIVEYLLDATKALSRSNSPFLVLHFGDDQDGAVALLKDILAAPQFHVLPLIVVGDEADTLVPQLSKVFATVDSCNWPCSAAEVVAAIRNLWGTYQKRIEQDRSSTAQAIDASVSEIAAAGSPSPTSAAPDTDATPHIGPAIGADAPDTKLPTQGSNPFHGFKSLPEAFFAQLGQLNLLGRTIGGDLYGKTRKDELFLRAIDSRLVGIAEAAERCLKGADTQVRSRVVRVGYMTFSLLSAVGIPSEKVAQATRAAILLASSCRTKRRLMRQDYFNATDPEIRKNVAKAIRESATKVSFELRLPQESLILGLLARLIGNEEVTTDSPECTLASAVYVSDIVDRICWINGYFNPQRGYMVLRLCKEGAFASTPGTVVATLIKFISEAIVAAPRQFALPSSMLKTYRAQVKNRGALPRVPRRGEKEVAIEALAPGMRLSRPLITCDGREIVESDAKLDEDLIWRVWQLAAIRPVEAALVLKSESESPFVDESLLSKDPNFL